MKLRLFSIYDFKSGVYLVPFPARSEVDAVRQITSSFDDNSIMQTPAGKKPEEFGLYSIGCFDDESGEIIPSRPELICRLDALRPPSTVLS